MPRSADYTIQGFLYQFNKTALEILKAQDDETITIEGIVEDIEIESSASTTLIQCKYHEANKAFIASMIYKPLLQMLKHFSDNLNGNIRYILFAHFPGINDPHPVVDETAFAAALASNDKTLSQLIKAVPKNIDLKAFNKRFTMNFGPKYEKIASEVGEKLVENGLPEHDIETLAYPNAIHLVAMYSIKHSQSNRKITKSVFLAELNAIRTTAISRWTLALKSHSKILQARRKQLKVHLDMNARLRYFVFEPSSIEDFDTEIVLFIRDYIDKYHFKVTHTDTAILCVCLKREQIQSIQSRLYAKGIITRDGYVGSQFEEAFFFKEPLLSKSSGGKVTREFSLRILCWNENREIMNNRKCDDLFVIGELNFDSLDTVDVNVERLEGVTMNELKYVFGVSNVYE